MPAEASSSSVLVRSCSLDVGADDVGVHIMDARLLKVRSLLPMLLPSRGPCAWACRDLISCSEEAGRPSADALLLRPEGPLRPPPMLWQRVRAWIWDCSILCCCGLT